MAKHAWLVLLALVVCPGLATCQSVKGIYVFSPATGGSDYTNHVQPYLISPSGAGHPWVTGAACDVHWQNLQPTNSTSYDWTSITGASGCLTEWASGSKHVGLLIGPSSYGTTNTGTPAWYTTPVGISSISQTAGVLSLVTAAPMNFFVGTVVGQQIQISGTGTCFDGGTSCTGNTGGVYTIQTNADSTHLTATGVTANNGLSATTGFAGNPMIIDPSGVCQSSGPNSSYWPAFWSPNFINAWERFMGAFTTQFNSNANVDFIQPGFGRGFENYVAPNAGSTACNAILTPMGYSIPNFISYLNSMAQFIAGVSTKPVMFGINYLDYPSCGANRDAPGCDNTDPLTVAANAAAHHLGIGAQGLQANDLTLTHCDSNFCAAITANPGLPGYEWQTVGFSNADSNTDQNSINTGPLPPLLPFFDSKGGTILEPYAVDALCTWDPTWTGNTQDFSTYTECQSFGYQSAWTNKYNDLFPPASLSFSPSSVSFGAVLIGHSGTPVTVTATNNGGVSVTFSSLTITGAGDFGQTSNCVTNSPIAPNGTCSIFATFTPTVAGSRSASISVSDSVAGSPQTIPLTGIGTTPTPPPPTAQGPWPQGHVWSISGPPICTTNCGPVWPP